MVALTPIVAQLEGADRIHQIGPNVRQGIWISMSLALLSMLLLPYLSNLLLWMDYEPEVVRITDGCQQAIIWGLPAAYAFLAIRHSLDGLGITRPCMYLTLLWPRRQYHWQLHFDLSAILVSQEWELWGWMDHDYCTLGHSYWSTRLSSI